VYKPNPNGETFTEEVTWGQLKKDWLTAYAKQTFKAYTDDLCGFNISAFAAPNALQSWALAGMKFDIFEKSGAWKTVVGTWQKNHINGEDVWFNLNPNHPLTQLQDKCKAWQDNTVCRKHAPYANSTLTCSVRLSGCWGCHIRLSCWVLY
jgi:hypothetical protein